MSDSSLDGVAMEELSDAVARAFVRARRRAEEIAAQTGTMLVDYVDGQVVRVPPPPRTGESPSE